ncbi:MAG TPA: lysophospholipid acyltransferase family protein [Chthonomonas sp.]|uniref:lysophospholipid acyltransferase family protein n=1 Tax=Chthonomonas sp. TaxID=2282153 RepID=UPI002B4AB5AA|nr:lysophospholipid acyltransferase family protein [Chthonomonas sp.]HLH79560.1 lysophospholipid acyltransferase family protein [Chthonomonas sp.]
MLYRIIWATAWLLLRFLYALFGGLKIEGAENVPRKGGVLVTPNHISDSDGPTVYLALKRPCWGMAKSELFQTRFLRYILRLFHAFPVKRYSADLAALRQAEDLLKQGEAVVIFPEGKLSENGQLQPFLPGVILVADRSGAPILPVALIGTDRLLPYGKLIPRPTRKPVVVRFGRPILPEELLKGLKKRERLEGGAERLRAIVKALLENQPYPSFTEDTPANKEEPMDEKEPSRESSS